MGAYKDALGGGERETLGTRLFQAKIESTKKGSTSTVEGDRGAGDREKRGREVYGGQEARFPRWRKAGEKGTNYTTLRKISQISQEVEANKYRAGTLGREPR